MAADPLRDASLRLIAALGRDDLRPVAADSSRVEGTAALLDLLTAVLVAVAPKDPTVEQETPA